MQISLNESQCHLDDVTFHGALWNPYQHCTSSIRQSHFDSVPAMHSTWTNEFKGSIVSFGRQGCRRKRSECSQRLFCEALYISQPRQPEPQILLCHPTAFAWATLLYVAMAAWRTCYRLWAVTARGWWRSMYRRWQCFLKWKHLLWCSKQQTPLTVLRWFWLWFSRHISQRVSGNNSLSDHRALVHHLVAWRWRAAQPVLSLHRNVTIEMDRGRTDGTDGTTHRKKHVATATQGPISLCLYLGRVSIYEQHLRLVPYTLRARQRRWHARRRWKSLPASPSSLLCALCVRPSRPR
jgi:hypothetical protein